MPGGDLPDRGAAARAVTENHALAAGQPKVAKKLRDAPPRKPLPRRILGWFIRLAVGAVIVLWILPRFIDYHEVWTALQHISPFELVLLSALSLLRVFTESSIYRALLRGLSLRMGARAYLSYDAIGQLLPPPGPELVLYTYFDSAGFDTETATAGVVGSFLFSTFGRLTIWPVAYVFLLAHARPPERTEIVTATSLLVLAVVAIVLWALARWESSAALLGTSISRIASWVRARFGRGRVVDLGPMLTKFRAATFSVMGQHWKAASGAVALNMLVSYVLLLVSLRSVGVSSDSLPWVDVFGAFALAFWLAAVAPINGSGVGVTDIVLISTLTDLSGDSSSDITAAVLIWRLFYSFAILPLGLYTLSQWRKDNPNFFKRHSGGVVGYAGEDVTTATAAPE
jgi:uncharacterized membrane protein YbhN (UPF0104 family)